MTKDSINNNINYDEDTGKFIIKDHVLWVIPYNKEIMEKDLSIIEINNLKSKADMTVLSNYDIDMLHKFAQTKFNYQETKDQFVRAPLKHHFHGLPDHILKTNEIMPLAYEHVKDPSKQLVLENFEEEKIKKKKHHIVLDYILCHLVILLIISVFFA